MHHEASTLETMSSMKAVLQDALDELVSTRTSSARIGEVLATLERLLAETCAQSSQGGSERMPVFVRLQDLFECNVPSRLLSWMSLTSTRLEYITSKTSPDHDRKPEITSLSAQLIQALSIIQGVALTHKASKRFLGRRYALEVLLDLLLTSRHVAPIPLTPSTAGSPPTSPKSEAGGAPKTNPSTSSASLASTLLDTLLCILVDSSLALRMFEDLGGVQLVVKILKRAGTPREVRMKCLEFLYFYLLDEATSVSPTNATLAPAHPQSSHTDTLANRTPSTSERRTPLHRSTLSSVYAASRDSSGSSASSLFSSSSSVSTSVTSIASLKPSSEASEEPISSFAGNTQSDGNAASGLAPSPRIFTPPNGRAQPRSLLMLRKEVDYVPLSPKKAQISRLGVAGSRTSSALRPRLKSHATMNVLSSEDTEGEEVPHTPRPAGSYHARGQSLSSHSGSSSLVSSPEAERPRMPLAGHRDRHRRAQSSTDVLSGLGTPLPQARVSSAAACLQGIAESQSQKTVTGVRTMEEKKEILGSMLGNVDALVEGVRKAGIWGLG